MAQRRRWAALLLLLALLQLQMQEHPLAAATHLADQLDEGAACAGALRRLEARPLFREVELRWEAPAAPSPAVVAFRVLHCELLLWGPQRCRSQVVAAGPAQAAAGGAPRSRAFAATVAGLRMATNYSFEVQPLRAPGEDSPDARLDGCRVDVTTKGFSARATRCLPHASEVEVQTGPHFGGRIAVEASGISEGGEGDGDSCALAGDPRSARAVYVLRIDHARCAASLNATTVAAFVLVQENRSILTHSARRFLVLCSFQPDTLTVRAGINLPTRGSNNDPESDNRLEQSQSEAVPRNFIHLDTLNDVQVAKLQHHRQMVDAPAEEIIQDQTTVQFVLMVILAVAAIIGCVASMWCFAPKIRKLAPLFSVNGPHPTSIYEHFENYLRDALSRRSADNISNNEVLTTQETVDNSHENEDGITEGIFTIRIPNRIASQRQTPLCITIEPTSHTEV